MNLYSTPGQSLNPSGSIKGPLGRKSITVSNSNERLSMTYESSRVTQSEGRFLELVVFI